MLRKFWIAMGVFWVLLIGWKLVAITGLLNPVTPAPRSSEFDCDPQKIAQQIENEGRVPLPVVYYWGPRTPALADWNSRELRPFRQGLPVGEWVEDTEKSNPPSDTPGSRREEWLSAFSLNEKCLKSSAVETLEQLPAHARFQRWYAQKRFPQSLSLWQKECFQTDGHPEPTQFHFSASSAVDVDETSCERIVNQYLNDEQIFILQDQQNARGWLIRNPACIQKIDNDEAFWAVELWRNQKPWQNSCHPSRDHRKVARVWFQSLAQVDDGRFDQPKVAFRKLVGGLKPPAAVLREKTDDTPELFKVQDFANGFDGAIERCYGKQQRQEMQAGFQKISEDYLDLTAKEIQKELERLCR